MTARSPAALDRRTLMQGALALAGVVGAGVATPAFAEVAAAGRYFTPARRAMLEQLSAAVIPQTDTPGAKEAGVPDFIDGLAANWASPDTRAMFDGALDAADAWSTEKAGQGLAALSPADLDTVVAAYDADAFARGDWPYRRLKDLIVTSYYASEAGATQELRYELAPGVWEASIPADADTRCWAV